MSRNDPRAEKRTDTDEESITDLGELQCGDEVLFGDRKRPLTVVDTAMRRDYSPVLDKELLTPTVLVKGDWERAKPFALAHRVSRITENDGQYDPALEQTEEIVAVDRTQTPDRWRYSCPYGHTDWDRTNNHAWCPACRQLNESGIDVDPEHYEILDKKREVMIPWEQLRLE